MTRGRPAKPIKTLELQGTARKDRHAKRAVEPSSGSSVVMPRNLKGEAAKFWKSCVPKLSAMKLLDGADVFYLTQLATAWANLKKEQDRYDAGEGHIYSVSSAWNMFDKIGSRFGLTPVDRTKLATAEEPTDALIEFIKASKN